MLLMVMPAMFSNRSLVRTNSNGWGWGWGGGGGGGGVGVGVGVGWGGTQLIMILMPTMALGISVDLRKGFCVWIYVVVV